ncbi:MAG: hypothetical protein EX271_03025 [Acidimicrobiales bacterium]|nr:hypothetical protein [Hyphomonadaceae bacterium]RZV43856.1 MAG: hypothetical protein EX271_03025 [Acidimicrobiales bacterium]
MTNIPTLKDIKFGPMPAIEGLEVRVLDVDLDRQIADAVFRFPPNQLVAMHRHVSQTNMMILDGELQIFEEDGSIRDRRTAGKYYRGTRDDAHTEGGGPDGAIVLYSVRGHGVAEIIEILDDKGDVLGALTFNDVAAIEAAQSA